MCLQRSPKGAATLHVAGSPIRLLSLVIVAMIIILAGPLGTVVISHVDAQAGSTPTRWRLTITNSAENSSQSCGQTPCHVTDARSQLTSFGFVNVHDEGGGPVADGSLESEFDTSYTDTNGPIHCRGSGTVQGSTVLTGSAVTGQLLLDFGRFSGVTATNTCDAPYQDTAPNNATDWAVTLAGSFLPAVKVAFEDNHIYSITNAYDRCSGSVCEHGLYQLIVFTTLVSTLPSDGTDNQGPISPPVDIPSPNSITLSDGSSIGLGGSTLAWKSPGNFTLNCTQTCGSDSFNFQRNSRGTDVRVTCPAGPCARLTAIGGASFSLSTTANSVTVKDQDGVVQVSSPNSGTTIFLSGVLGSYSQSAVVHAHENSSDLQKSAATTYLSAPKVCNSGTVSLNSGQPITGNLVVQFCALAKQVTNLQFNVPPSLQNRTAVYTVVSNSSALGMMSSGEDSTGGRTTGGMTLTGVPTLMPILLVSPSGSDPVTIAVNNTGASTALVTFQLQFPVLSVANSTTISTTSILTSTSSSPNSTSSTSSTGGGIPEFPFQLVAASVFTAILVASYLMVRQRRTAS